jgi:acyl-[acyl-carrier-protein]-phospholipid O-acyltransferase/long-chain-fatty-acid--[acyl-carrier-protein] ligase
MMKQGLRKRGFYALILTQFLGAFNDNAFKLVIAFIAVDHFAQQQGGSLYLSLSGALFVLPFLLFSTYAGYLADRFSKKYVIVATKVLELAIMALGFWALKDGGFALMLAVLFLMGLQSALFSPSKYGILPEILTEEKLSEGNGLIQLWTYAAIILGQAAGGYLVYVTQPDVYRATAVFIACSLLGLVSSFFVCPVPASGARRPFEWNIWKDVSRNLTLIKTNRAIYLSILGLLFFGFLGALFQLNILLYSRKIMQIDHLATSILLIILATGIGAGSILAGKFSDQKVELGLVPLGAIGLVVFSVKLGFVYHSYLSVAVTLLCLGLSSGFYMLPLNTLIQQESPKDRRGQFLAVNNFLSFSAILVGSLAIYVFRDIFHFNAAHIFVVTGIVTACGAVYICRLLPYALVRFVMWLLTHSLYRIRVVNKGNIPQQGGALLVSNHVSLVDALVILVSIQRPVRFMIGRAVYKTRIFNPLFRLAKGIPISSADGPKEQLKSLRMAREAIENGELVCIFAEGRLTRTGNILKFNKGLEHIMNGIDCMIVPVHLDRIWGSIFSFEGGRYYYKVPKILPYPLTVTFGEPLPAKTSAFEVRNRVRELGAEAFPYRMEERWTLSEAFWREARYHPDQFCMADSGGQVLSYGQALVAAVSLSDRLKSRLEGETHVGILIPPSVGGALANIAVSMLRKVPVNMNYTGSAEALRSIVQQCGMRTVITSKKFVEKTGIVLPVKPLYIEDTISAIRLKHKALAVFKSIIYPRWISFQMIFGRRRNRSMDDLATLMFTSGSTGEPKGVMLTHANITSNLEGLYQAFSVDSRDTVLGILPFFHSFGFTAALWFPLVCGMGVTYHVNPLDAKVVGNLVRKHRATIMMCTPTFLSAYTRRCDAEDFKSLRLVVVGAEKLKSGIAQAFREKFNLEPMEGYGCTELSPIVSLNLPDYDEKGPVQKAHKEGTIGMPLPGVAVKVVDQETGQSKGPDEEGLLWVKGANVMKGYLNQPEKTATVIRDGWYMTGDVAKLDEDGFITITDRLSRFSKIGGEMVPHIKVEERIHAALKAEEPVCVVTAVPEPKNGERLVVLCRAAFDVGCVLEELNASDLPKLWIPDRTAFYQVEDIPLLGSGKLDLGAVKRLAMTLAEERSL